MEELLEPTVSDHVPTGTPDILDSPHVSDGPGKIANAPVPSVFVSYVALESFVGFLLFATIAVDRFSHHFFIVFSCLI